MNEDICDNVHCNCAKTDLCFSTALSWLKDGAKIKRATWGKSYLWLLPAATIKAEWCREQHIKNLCTDNQGQIDCESSIRMWTEDNKVLTGWVPSQSDMFANDWIIL
jgi:hypothetical protein